MNITKRNYMDWSYAFVFIVPICSFFAFLYKELQGWRRETREETASIREETASIREEIRIQSSRSDKLYEIIVEETKIQSARSDKLYEIVIGLLEKGK